MNRDRFKFRVWDKGLEQYIDNPSIGWFAGYLHNRNFDNFNAFIPALIRSDLFIVEQCTGLKDKNGNLIYEGDIVRERDILKDFAIKWSERGFTNPTNGLYSLFDAPSEWEIIGNIHDKRTINDK